MLGGRYSSGLDVFHSCRNSGTMNDYNINLKRGKTFKKNYNRETNQTIYCQKANYFSKMENEKLGVENRF